MLVRDFWRSIAFGVRILAVAAVFTIAPDITAAQTVVDKIVATVSDGVRTELITLSDLKWQLALQPGISLRPTSSDDLNLVLRRLVDQRIFVLEATRQPRNPATDKEINDKINEIVAHFPSASDFESRLREVGFQSISDQNFRLLIADRIAIDKFLTFRFRTFIVVTPADEEKYYRETWAPNFRRRFPGLLMPTLEEKRPEIRSMLIEDRVEANMQGFLDDAKQRVSIVYLSTI